MYTTHANTAHLSHHASGFRRTLTSQQGRPYTVLRRDSYTNISVRLFLHGAASFRPERVIYVAEPSECDYGSPKRLLVVRRATANKETIDSFRQTAHRIAIWNISMLHVP